MQPSESSGYTRPLFRRTGKAVSSLDVGPKLRAKRLAAKVSLRGLARETGFSPSFLSQVELGQCSPSLASLEKICVALGLALPELLRDGRPPRAGLVMRRKDRELLRSEWSKASAESLLPPDADERMTALLLRLDRGGRTGRMRGSVGERYLAYCVRGKARVVVDERGVHTLGRGDSLALEGVGGWAWENAGSGPTELVLVTARVGAD